MDNNDVDEEDFYKYEHEDEDCAISTSARNYPTHATRVTFVTMVIYHRTRQLPYRSRFFRLRSRASVALATRVRFFFAIVGNLPPQEFI